MKVPPPRPIAPWDAKNSLIQYGYSRAISATNGATCLGFHRIMQAMQTGVDPVWWTPLKLIFEVSDAPRYRTAYPPEFRRQMVDLVRSGRTPEELACEFEPTTQSISTWVKQAERDAGKRIDGPTSAEREELGKPSTWRTIACVRSATSWQRRREAWFARESKASPNGFYRFMSAHQAMYPIRTMARVLKVSASGWYAWRSRPASARGDR